MSIYTLNIRPKRQITLPASLLVKIGASIGDELIAEIYDRQAVLKPKKKIFLDALCEIQAVIINSGVSEAELQKSAIQDRKKWSAKYDAS